MLRPFDLRLYSPRLDGRVDMACYRRNGGSFGPLRPFVS